jgi:hypothetical protein
VTVHDGASTATPSRALQPRLDLRNHSPTGFCWGYGGSGPAQLALALLADVFDDGTAQRFYQEFKWDVIRRLPMGEPWELTEEQVREALYALPCWLEAAKA